MCVLLIVRLLSIVIMEAAQGFGSFPPGPFSFKMYLTNPLSYGTVKS